MTEMDGASLYTTGDEGLVGRAHGFGMMYLTGRDLDISAVPELLRVCRTVAALTDFLLDPVGLGRSARAGPGWRVELGVALVLARVPSVCKDVR